MTNFVIDASMDAGLDYIKTNATAIHVCSGDPADRAAVLTNSLGNVAIDSSDFTRGDGDTSGRKDTLAQQSGTLDGSGTAAVVAVISGTELLRKNNLSSSQGVTSGNPFTISAHDHEVRDPT